jgi:hypothetical protein
VRRSALRGNPGTNGPLTSCSASTLSSSAASASITRWERSSLSAVRRSLPRWQNRAPLRARFEQHAWCLRPVLARAPRALGVRRPARRKRNPRRFRRVAAPKARNVEPRGVPRGRGGR